MDRYQSAKLALENHGVISFPTETVCGLAVFYDDVIAYNKLNQIKGQREDKPYSLMLGSVEEIEKYAVVDEKAKKLINKYLPGPLTLLLKAKDNVPSHVTHNTGVIGIRVPDFKLINELITYLGKPLLVPSANRSKKPPMHEMEDVKKEFKDEVSYYFDGHSNNDKASTIVSLLGDVRIIRQGLISNNDIFKTLGVKIMKISIGCDHGGLEYKDKLVAHLKSLGHEVIDCGTFTKESCHYPTFAAKAALEVGEGRCERGIVVCTSGEGVMITANKIKGVRCGMGYNDDVSRLMRQHNNANMISFGQKFMDYEDVERRVDIFLNTEFEGGRHQTRVDLINDLEK